MDGLPLKIRVLAALLLEDEAMHAARLKEEHKGTDISEYLEHDSRVFRATSRFSEQILPALELDLRAAAQPRNCRLGKTY